MAPAPGQPCIPPSGRHWSSRPGSRDRVGSSPDEATKGRRLGSQPGAAGTSPLAFLPCSRPGLGLCRACPPWGGTLPTTLPRAGPPASSPLGPGGQTDAPGSHGAPSTICEVSLESSTCLVEK